MRTKSDINKVLIDEIEKKINSITDSRPNIL